MGVTVVAGKICEAVEELMRNEVRLKRLFSLKEFEIFILYNIIFITKAVQFVKIMVTFELKYVH